MSFCKSRHFIGTDRFEIRDSIEHKVTIPSSSKTTSVTTKCFSFLLGVTAVHLLFSNFLGLILFIALFQRTRRGHEGIAKVLEVSH